MMQDVAVLSPLFLTEAALPHLQKAPGGGSVVRACVRTCGRVPARVLETSSDHHACVQVMVSSLAPEVPWPDTAPFNLAKAAQNTLTQTLAFKVRPSRSWI